MESLAVVTTHERLALVLVHLPFPLLPPPPTPLIYGPSLT